MYIVMEYFKQSSELKTIIEQLSVNMNEGENKRKPILPENDVCHIMYMLVKGLCHIHNNGIVHRDLKTENCLLDTEYNLRIIDFGLAKVSTNREFGQ